MGNNGPIITVIIGNTSNELVKICNDSVITDVIISNNCVITDVIIRNKGAIITVVICNNRVITQ